MKSLVFLGFVALAWASSIDTPFFKTPETSYSTEDYQYKHKTVLQLFQHVYQPDYFPEHENIGLSYSFEDNIKGYTNPKYVYEFFKYYPSGGLPKGQVFSIFYDKHQNEAIAFFRLLYSAVDFDTFYKTAVWGRMHLNEGLYIYSLSVALVHRPDTWFIELPPIYEIYPYYFFNFNVFKTANEKTGYHFGNYQYLKPGYNKQKPYHSYGPYSPEYQQQYYGKHQYPYGKYPYHPGKSITTEQKPYYSYGPYSRTTYRPYSSQHFRTTQKHPFFYMTKHFNKPMTSPYSEEYFQKYPSQFYGQYQKPKYSYGNNLFESYQRPPHFKTPEIPEFYQQEREKIPLEYYQQGITIDANYTTYHTKSNPEYSLSYFTEDIGLNAFYYYYHLYFPFWMKSEEIYFDTQRRGEQFYYIYQQLLARYSLERISNGLGEIPLLEYGSELPYGFRTDLRYPNGMPFPERPDHAPIANRYHESPAYYDNDTLSVMNIQLYERRIIDAIDSGFVLTREGKYYSIFEPQGFEILGNLIQSNPESPNARYYGPILVFARYLLGYSKYPLDQYQIAPCVMEQFETSLRDPAFYQLFKGVVYYFQRYKQYLPTYTQEELFWNGVKIQDVKVDKLITYFDSFYSDISNVMQSKVKTEEVPVHVRQYRLNHYPFNYYLNVRSEKPFEAVIRVFLGPKYDVNGKTIDINKNRMSFVEMDKFHYSLVAGMNTIERNSREFYGYAPDRTTYKELFMQLVNYDKPVEYTPKVEWGFPQRLLLPKGTKEGQAYQMYFLVTPYQPIEKVMPTKYNENMPFLHWDRTFDDFPYGYPFDRPIDESVFYTPNSYFKDVVIYSEFSPEYVTENSYTPYYQY